MLSLKKVDEQPKYRNRGLIIGLCAKHIAKRPIGIAAKFAMDNARKVSEISENDSVNLLNAAKKGLEQTGLSAKGVEILKFNEANISKETKQENVKNIKDLYEYFYKINYNESDKSALNAIKESLLSNKKIKKFAYNWNKAASYIKNKKDTPEDIKNINFDLGDFLAKATGAQFKIGRNACCLNYTSKIIIPDKHLQTSVFHEMGHALNANGGIILKGLQKCRQAEMIFPGIILLASLLNKRKTTDETKPTDSKLQKGADFIKRNAGKLTLLAYLPMVAEEGIASLRGQGVAKKLVKSGELSKELFKKIKLTNLGGFSSYVMTAIGVALATKFAINIKDKIQAKYEEKQMMKYESKFQSSILNTTQG